jgi:uncharacterized protein
MNQVLLACLVSLFFAHVLKVIFSSFKIGKFAYWRLLENGGMPSGHSSFVTTLAVSVGLVEGFDSILFSIVAVLWAIVIIDSVRVRGVLGKQSAALNKLFKFKKFDELLGHSWVEVFSGIIVGAIVALYFFQTLI